MYTFSYLVKRLIYLSSGWAGMILLRSIATEVQRDTVTRKESLRIQLLCGNSVRQYY